MAAAAACRLSADQDGRPIGPNPDGPAGAGRRARGRGAGAAAGEERPAARRSCGHSAS